MKSNMISLLEIEVGVYITMGIFWEIMGMRFRGRWRLKGVGIGMGRVLIRNRFNNISILDFYNYLGVFI